MGTQLAFALRARGHADATSGLNAVVATRITEAVRFVSERLAVFSSDDVMRELSVEIRDQIATRPSIMGAVLHNCAVASLIEPTGQYVRSAKPSGRARRIALWRKA